MLRSRIIPCLLVKNGGLVKTIKFRNPKYVGDPINAVRIFNEKEVDELIVLDIDATIHNREPDYNLIRNLAAECRMPLCYGGGVKAVDQIKKIISLGVEKVAISSAVVGRPELIADAAALVGSQSLVVVMDAKKAGSLGRYELFTHNGTKKINLSSVEFARRAESLGAGEIVINSIDNDGVMKGYDLNLITEVRQIVSLPITVIGGAGKLDHMVDLIKHFGIIGAAAGSLFVFKGKYRAVLINYPDREDKESIFRQAGQFA